MTSRRIGIKVELLIRVEGVDSNETPLTGAITWIRTLVRSFVSLLNANRFVRTRRF